MKKTLLLLVVALALASCGSKTSSKDQSSSDVVKPEATPSAVKGKYAIKSGIIESKGTMMGMEALQTLYFDDFGALEATVTTMEMMGTKINSVTITRDGYTYNFDAEKKAGTKNIAGPGGANLNFEDLSDQIIKEYNIKKEGKETILGKVCEKYSMDYKSMSLKGNYWVWKGIALKMDVDMSMMKMLFEATSVQENVNVPAEKFAIPADITFQ